MAQSGYLLLYIPNESIHCPSSSSRHFGKGWRMTQLTNFRRVFSDFFQNQNMEGVSPKFSEISVTTQTILSTQLKIGYNT
jgi:hypothetical protein